MVDGQLFWQEGAVAVLAPRKRLVIERFECGLVLGDDLGLDLVGKQCKLLRCLGRLAKRSL